jgi:WhiB family transcriptional regulator, redox-sensing transcriptional regulator
MPGPEARPGPAATPDSEALPCLRAPDLFFAEYPADIARAKELCRGCPITAACLAGALDRGEPWGVWGGELILNGTVVASKRGRGRPPGSSRRGVAHPVAASQSAAILTGRKVC